MGLVVTTSTQTPTLLQKVKVYNGISEVFPDIWLLVTGKSC